jgi:PIN domain
MLVSLDSMILIWMFQDPDVNQEGIEKETRELQQRATILVRKLEDEAADIVVPTPAIAEYLAGINPKHHGALTQLFEEKFFHMPTFDLRAAARAAELWQAHRKLPKAEQMQRRQLKLDVMIIACAQSAGVTFFYSHEPSCRRMATYSGMIAKDLPTHSENLLVDAEIRTGRPL